jgi:hypothetical protein
VIETGVETSQGLRLLILADLALDRFGMVGDVGPGIDQVDRPQRGKGIEDPGFGEATPPVLLQRPYRDPRARDARIAAADSGRRLDARAEPGQQLLDSEREDPGTGPGLIDDDQGTRREIRLVLAERRENMRSDVLGENTRAANLEDAGAGGMGQGQGGTEVEIVGEYDPAFIPSPGHGRRILGARVSHLGPVDGRPSRLRQEAGPLHGEVHVQDDPEAHGATSSSSRSCNRQAA